jgi:hypothetical protein
MRWLMSCYCIPGSTLGWPACPALPSGWAAFFHRLSSTAHWFRPGPTLTSTSGISISSDPASSGYLRLNTLSLRNLIPHSPASANYLLRSRLFQLLRMEQKELLLVIDSVPVPACPCPDPPLRSLQHIMPGSTDDLCAKLL